MKNAPSGTTYSVDQVNDNLDIAIDDTNQFMTNIDFIQEYDNAMLEYNHDFTDAMNFISDL